MVDRAAVSVGDAVTLKVAVKGTGNVRNVRPPALPPLAGWKSYEPKTDVAVDGAATITGTKTVEWLMRPERPGKTIVPSLELETFDPGGQALRNARAASRSRSRSPARPGANAAPRRPGAPARRRGRRERRRAGPSGRSTRAAAWRASAASPSSHARLSRPPSSRRRSRWRSWCCSGACGSGSGATRAARGAGACARWCGRRLRAAEAHRAAGRAGDFYIEIDRVLREALSARLGTRLGGLRLDELGALLRARGLPDGRDGAAWSPSSRPATRRASRPAARRRDPAALAAMLARAGELIDAIERAPLGEEARS